MGNWNITIQGVGQHHNIIGEEGQKTYSPADANMLLKKFVEDLRAHGHSVSHASITAGRADVEV